jgi:hypothetical protein
LSCNRQNHDRDNVPAFQEQGRVRKGLRALPIENSEEPFDQLMSDSPRIVPTSASVSIRGVEALYRPGQTVTGTVEWTGDTAPRRIEVRLFWLTSGAGPGQIGLVERLTISDPEASGSSRFEFILPKGPWSFQGMLTALSWAVEALIVPSGQNAHVIFSMGPKHRPTSLYAMTQIRQSNAEDR